MTRTRVPALRTLPSSTWRTSSRRAMSVTSSDLPLNENDELRAATRRPSICPSALMISSEMASERPEGSSVAPSRAVEWVPPTNPGPIPGADVPSHDVTRLLASWKDGDEAALQQLLPVVHEELRRLARRQMAGGRPGHALQPRALVHEP